MAGLSPRIEQLIEEAEGAAIRYRRENNLEPNLFVAADYVQVYRAMEEIAQPGDTFLEWGSGVGTITLLADMLGFEAYGIEIEPGLVEISEELNEQHGCNAHFVAGTFVPESYDWTSEHADPNFYTDPSGEDGCELLELDPHDLDVIYAYPWPGEEPFLRDVFERCARPGALFLTFHGLDGIKTYRKPLTVRD